MTSANVTQAASMYLGAANVNTVGSMNSTVDDSFSQVMSRTSQDSGSSSKQDDHVAAVKAPVKVERSNVRKAAEGSEEEAAGRTQEAAAAEKDTQEVSTEAANPDDTAGKEETEEILTEAVSEVKKAIAETLELSEEELETLMSEIGLTNSDLLKPEMMSQIVMAAAGETDQMSILTDENLYADVQQLTEMADSVVSDVKSQLQLDDAAFTEILQQMEAADVSEPVQQMIPEPDLEKSAEPVIIVTEGQTDAAEAAVADKMSEPQESGVKTEIKTEAETDEKLNETNGDGEEGHAAEVSGKEKTEKRTEGQSAGENHESGSHFLQNFQKSSVEAWNDNVAETQTAFSSETPDTENIMNQITEYMKVEVKPEMTELELRLHPETLGTVHIHLSAKEGVVTAQFTTENESVRTVLEAQTAQLKENLNQQGIKVEAVEVTIASHAFDRSFAENGDGNSRYEEPKKKGVRRIRLEDDVPLEEMELSDEERIAAEMMEQNGNTVDYTV